MTLQKLLEEASQSHAFWAIAAMTLIQVAPIKINPWSWIFKMFYKFICYMSRMSLAPIINKLDELNTKVDNMQSELNTKVDTMQSEMNVVKKEFEVKNANDWRWDILDFFNSTINGRPHYKEEWNNVIDQIKKYERHVELHDIDNGVLEEASKWLRDEYHEHIRRNDFLAPNQSQSSKEQN